MSTKYSRRDIVKGGLIMGVWLSAAELSARSVRAAGLPPLDVNDPTAKALAFVADAGKVDAAGNPTFKPGQKCATCAQFQGKPADSSGGCNLFPGKSVPSAGWCKVWAPKT